MYFESFDGSFYYKQFFSGQARWERGFVGNIADVVLANINISCRGKKRKLSKTHWFHTTCGEKKTISYVRDLQHFPIDG